jgi:hypothetical protein
MKRLVGMFSDWIYGEDDPVIDAICELFKVKREALVFERLGSDTEFERKVVETGRHTKIWIMEDDDEPRREDQRSEEVRGEDAGAGGAAPAPG